MEGLDKLKTFIHLIWTLASDLAACSRVPQPLGYSNYFLLFNFSSGIPPMTEFENEKRKKEKG
jgi:hypothetical protein